MRVLRQGSHVNPPHDRARWKPNVRPFEAAGRKRVCMWDLIFPLLFLHLCFQLLHLLRVHEQLGLQQHSNCIYVYRSQSLRRNCPRKSGRHRAAQERIRTSFIHKCFTRLFVVSIIVCLSFFACVVLPVGTSTLGLRVSRCRLLKLSDPPGLAAMPLPLVTLLPPPPRSLDSPQMQRSLIFAVPRRSR